MGYVDRPQGFWITGKKGFHIKFENGYTVSVQFGPGNYCDNYELNIGYDDEKAGKEGSGDAECAVLKDGELIDMPVWGDNVKGRMKPEDVLKLLNWAYLQNNI